VTPSRVPQSTPVHDLVTLKVELREARTALEKLAGFEEMFGEFCRPLVQAVQQFDSGMWEPEGTVMAVVVANADLARIQLSALQGQVLPKYQDPLAKLLRTNLRTGSRALYELLGVVAAREDMTGEPFYVISTSGCARTMAECQGQIDERRHELNADVTRLTATIEEVESEQGRQRAHEIALAQTGATKAFAAKVKGSFRWLFEGTLRKVILWTLGLLATFLAGSLLGPKAASWLRGTPTVRDTTSITSPPAHPPTH
jgi:hypothetical protein